jgi:hypothetical protein
MGFQILNLIFLFNDESEEHTQTIILQSIMVASVIPMVGLALWGVCNNNKKKKDFIFFVIRNLIYFYFPVLGSKRK